MPERYRIGAALLVLMSTMGLNFMAVAPLLPLIQQEYQVSQTTVGLLIGAVGLVLAVGMTPGGILVSRLGTRRSLVLGGALIGAGTLIPFAPNFEVVLVLRVVFSLGAALAIPASAVVIMQWFSQRELPVWNAGLGAGQSFAMSVSVFLAAPLAAAVDWRLPLALYGAAALLGTIVWALTGRDHGRGAGLPPGLGEIAGAMRERSTLLLTLAFFGPIGQFNALQGLLPTYYSVERGMTLADAAALASLISLVGIPGTLLGGILPQRTGVRRPFVLACGALGGVSGAASALLPAGPFLPVAILVVGVCCWLYFPVLTTMAMELPGMTPAKVAVVLASSIGVGNLSGFVAPLVVGILKDTTGSLLPGLLLWAAASTSLLIAGLMLPETGPRAKPAPPDAALLADLPAAGETS